ncbi:MAG: ATP-dependent DNA helicase RecG [Bacteroidetes bacterium 4572_77]|nr:MAG: ATP-dependent DNA helicase RecG [Bacteroidetes bacterium 4572_77]
MLGRFLDSPIKYLKGVGPAREKQLKAELGIAVFEDLIYYFPFRYIDRSKFYQISSIHNDMPFVLLRGKITQMQTIGMGSSMRLSAQLVDDSGSIELVWFRGVKWIKDSIKAGKEYVVFGKPSLFNRKYNIAHPEIEDFETAKNSQVQVKLQPFYSSTEKLRKGGLDSKGFAKMLRNLVEIAPKQIPENLSTEIIEKYDLISREDALRLIHFPANSKDILLAQKRLKFEELFFIQLHLLKSKLIRAHKNRGVVFKEVGDHFKEFYHEHLPFTLTNAQKKVIREIRLDVGSGHQMNRLLQGDVGSGKTLVALMSMFLAIDNSYQACMMAPTEILANQHFEGISEFLKDMNINIGLLTGSTKKKDRKVLHEALQNGEMNILIGTHALIEDKVVFKNLGMVVIDEQHRFGVAQRAKLWKKAAIPPHILVMTATPIPRTLAMTLYGDLDYSVIDELPPGRKEIQTYHFYDKDRLKVFGFMKKQIALGRQIYVVYPLIQESETLDLKDLQDGYESISRAFPIPQYQLSIVHGKMKAQDKDYEMQRFARKETQIMIATTVIEVGVNIPNASVMIIENAERFGLSQLHQLRGRVGRGSDQSYCLLMTSYKMTAEGKIRMKTMVDTTDGFKIADVDLKLRGPGDLTGTQQSGIMDLKIADLIKDEAILKAARAEAIDLLESEKGLDAPENLAIAKELARKERRRQDWSSIS